MPKSHVAKGSYFKARSRRFLESAGYQIAEMELLRGVRTPRGMVFVKKDQWGADVAGKNAEHIVFVQVKSVGLGRSISLSAAKRAFVAAGPWPPCTRRVIHVWRHRVHAPEVIECP